MENKVLKFIQQHDLLKPGQSVLVGLSGGADSVALSMLLKNSGYKVAAAHCNFHLRADESDRDEAFVQNFCEEWGIPLTITHFNTTEYASEKKISIEMAARELRYGFFQKLMKSAKIANLAVAHHQNDQAETLLLNLIRGTGIHGLRGMLPKNGPTIRPLLCVNREEILRYLAEKRQHYVEDSTNQCVDYTRNKIRLELLPYLKTLNPSIISGLNHTASILSEVELFYNLSIKEQQKAIILTANYELGKTSIELKRGDTVMKSAKMRPLWHEVLSPYGFTDSQIQNLMNLDSTCCGRVFYAEKWVLYVDRNILSIKERIESRNDSIIIYETEKCIEFNKVKIRIESICSKDYPVLEKDLRIALFDADKVTFPLTLRKIATGDRFTPFGMKEKKLVSDILTNQKVPVWEKKEQLVLCSSDGAILWLVGRRTSANHAISAQTTRILRFVLH